MYKSDKHGEYQVRHSWIEAYDSGGAKGRYSYYQECELRLYSDGSTMIRVNPPIYLHEKPAAILAHTVFVAAERELRTLANPETK